MINNLLYKLKSKSAPFQSILKIYLLINMTMFFLLIMNYGYAIIWAGGINLPSFIIVCLTALLLFSSGTILFIKKIYHPITKIEKTVMTLTKETSGYGWIDFAKGKGNYPLSDNIDSMFTHIRESMNREYTAEILKKQAELFALQSQINPHFLYNTLESIRGQALMEGVEEIADMTEALSTFFRYSISKRGNLVSLEDELKNVENYFIIQQYRFSNKFCFALIYDEDEDDILEYKLPKLTIQPIVENAIYHGLETKVGQGSITTRIITTAKRLIINISDDGVGIDKTTLNSLNERLNNCMKETQDSGNGRHTGIALLNVNQRIKLYFGEQYGISVSSTPMLGTNVEIVMPLIKENICLGTDLPSILTSGI